MRTENDASPVLVADGGQKLPVFSPPDGGGHAWVRAGGGTIEYGGTARHHDGVLRLHRQLQFWHTYGEKKYVNLSHDTSTFSTENNSISN